MDEKEYIERDRLYELGYWHGATPTLDNPFPDGVDAVDTKDIDSIPAADVREVKRGKWTDGNGNPVPWDEQNKDCPRYSAYCSVCGEWLTASDEYPAIGNFCPNCGADMREES